MANNQFPFNLKQINYIHKLVKSENKFYTSKRKLAKKGGKKTLIHVINIAKFNLKIPGKKIIPN